MVSNHVPLAGIAAIFIEEFKWKIDSWRKRKELNQETVGYSKSTSPLLPRKPIMAGHTGYRERLQTV